MSQEPMSRERAAAFIARLDAAEARLAVLAAGPLPDGATEPSPGGEETWNASQVWGHLSEFPAYWTASARRVLAAPAHAPAAFGRTTTDASRIGPIAAAASLPADELFRRCAAGIAEARALIGELSGPDWDRIGVHVTRGAIPVSGIMETMIAGHLEEHAAQLERLAADA
jgi:hypothetical protein